MVSMGADVGVSRPRTSRVTLASLLAERDASLVASPSAFALAGLRAKRLLGVLNTASSAGARAVIVTLSLLAVFANRHALVLAGIAAWVVAAWQYSSLAGLVALGAGAFFLEGRRR